MYVRRAKLAGVLSAAVLGSTVIVGSAHATGLIAYNETTEELINPPIPSDPVHNVNRTIDLPRGCYDWVTFNGPSVPSHESIELAEGTYTWNDTLTPELFDFDQASTLQTGTLPMAHHTDYVVDPGPVTDTVTWGSSLEWLRANC